LILLTYMLTVYDLTLSDCVWRWSCITLHENKWCCRWYWWSIESEQG